MKPTITHHNNTWRVHVGNHLTGAWATKERAQKHAAQHRNHAHQETRHSGTRASSRSTQQDGEQLMSNARSVLIITGHYDPEYREYGRLRRPGNRTTPRRCHTPRLRA